ncbi:uncharacterized protein N7498_009709 [Penicillium cinerascens]|uniref:Uncharacterized protein n=1 Tax=Penicillium cinerascens TaxID=70096 RepID=A0A9W9J550_9EURO|nr:uncharacterized protein N7498_009709 [Penicillium cinerascens]KAJ5190724.1 hypothetical protein N7498_009709 [Penicillium cinerascens]
MSSSLLMRVLASMFVEGQNRLVEKVVGKTMQETKEWSEDEVNNWSKTVKKKSKWQEDVWG